MKKIYALLLVAILAITGFSMFGSEKTIIHSDATVVSYDKDQLVNDSTVIIFGEVISSEVQNDFQGFPVTDYKVKVNKTFKGEPGAEVEVRTVGGENDEIKYIADEDMASFEIGEKVTLFLTDDKGERPDKGDFGYFVVGQFQGKLIKENGKLKNKKFGFDEANFAKELKEIEKQNKIKKLKPIKAEPGSDI